MEKQYITLKGREIPLSIRRHRRAKRISLRIGASMQDIVLTLPVRTSLAKGMDFFHAKTDWILTHVADASVTTPFADGETLPIFGKDYRIVRSGGRGVTHLAGSLLQVYGAPEFTPRRVKDFLKKHLHAYCSEAAEQVAAELGKSIRSVRISDTRSRWGSCNRLGDLQFHWRLIFAPLPVLDYLIAHEVAHLVEMNHSPRFWQCVARLYPEYVKARRWLKRDGQALHLYG